MYGQRNKMTVHVIYQLIESGVNGKLPFGYEMNVIGYQLQTYIKIPKVCVMHKKHVLRHEK